jgi:hypothetical protein
MPTYNNKKRPKSRLLHAHCFLIEHHLKADSPSLLCRPKTKASTQNHQIIQVNSIIFILLCGNLILGLLVVVGLWVLVLHHSWHHSQCVICFLSMLYLVVWSLLTVWRSDPWTTSSSWCLGTRFASFLVPLLMCHGFFVNALSCCVIIETQQVKVRCTRQSPLMRGRSLRPSRLKSVVCDKVLR